MRLFATASLMLLLPTAGVAANRYAERYHVVTSSFGCVVPWTTWALNDERNPRRRDARWVNRVIGRGGCRLASPIQEWERVGRIGGLVLLRLVPSRVGATPLLFRPSDLRVGEIAVPAPAPPAATIVPVPSGQPGPGQGIGVPPAAASAPNSVAPGVAAAGVATPTAASNPTTPPAAPSSATVSPPEQQAAAPEADSPAASATGSGPATQDPSVKATQAASAGGTQEAPIIATPLAAPAAENAPTPPAPDATAPVPTVPPSVQAPAATVPDAPLPPPAPVPIPAPLPTLAPPSTPVHAAYVPATIRAPRSRFIIGLIAVLAVLAGLVIVCLRFLVGRRRDGATTGQAPAELFEAPRLAADEVDSPPIDHNAYRRACADSLTKAGWQARMSFPAGRLTADIMARRDGRLLTVQCRPSMRPLEAAVVQEALLVRRAHDAQVAAVVSNAGYTMAARTLAAASGVRLLHETELPEFVN